MIPSTSAATLTDLWEPFAIPLVNWNDQVKLTSGYRTEIDHGLSSAEKRIGLRSVPLKSQQVTVLGTDGRESNLLERLLARRGLAKSLIPIYSDMSVLTAGISSGVNVIPCDTTYRRLNVGYRIAVVKAQRYGTTLIEQTADFNILTIQSKTDTSITTTDNTTVAFTAGSLIFPLMETRPVLSQDSRAYTSDITVFDMDSIEVAGTTQVPGTFTIGSNPTGFDTYNGLPVLFNDDFSSPVAGGRSRYGSEDQMGLGVIQTVEGSYTRPEFSLRINALDRATAWKYINFFDSRAGRLHPFYVVSPKRLGSVTVIGQTGISVKPFMPVMDWARIEAVAIALNDGTHLYRTLTHNTRTVLLGEYVDILFYNSSITATQASKALGIFPLVKSRFVSDEMTENWLSTTKMQASLETVGVEQEKSVTISDIADVTTSPVSAAFSPLLCGGGCWKLTNCNDEEDIIYSDKDWVALNGLLVSLVEYPDEGWIVSRSSPCGGDITDVTLDQILSECPDPIEPVPCGDILADGYFSPVSPYADYYYFDPIDIGTGPYEDNNNSIGVGGYNVDTDPVPWLFTAPGGPGSVGKWIYQQPPDTFVRGSVTGGKLYIYDWGGGGTGNTSFEMNSYTKAEVEALIAADWNIAPLRSVDEIEDGACVWMFELKIWPDNVAVTRGGFAWMKLDGATPAGTYKLFMIQEQTDSGGSYAYVTLPQLEIEVYE